MRQTRGESALFGLFRRRTRSTRSSGAAVGRAEEKRRAAAAAKDQWLTMLREMEQSGESDHPRYETYYQAYLSAREQEKRAELELFNVRNGLAE